MTEQFSKHGFLEKNFEAMQEKLHEEDDQQFVVVVVGETGSSKTSLSLLLDWYLNDGDMDLGTYCLKHDSFMDEYKSRPVRKTIVMEEGRESFDKNKYSHTENKEARDALRQYRKYQHTVFINFQDASDLTPELPNSIAHCMIRTPGKGIAWFYGKNSMREMWSGKDFTGWSDPDFKDYFPDPASFIPEQWQSYEEKALEKLDDGDGSVDEEPEEDFERLYSTKELAERFGVTSSTVRNWLDEGGYKVLRLTGNNERRIPKRTVDKLVEDKLEEAT